MYADKQLKKLREFIDIAETERIGYGYSSYILQCDLSVTHLTYISLPHSPVNHLSQLSLARHSPVTRPSLARHSPVTRPSLARHSPVPQPWLTRHSPVTRPSLTRHSLVTHPSLTHHSPVTHRSLTRHSPVTHLSLTCHSPVVHVSESVPRDVSRRVARDTLQQVEALLKHLQEIILELFRDTVLGEQLVDAAHGTDAERLVTGCRRRCQRRRVSRPRRHLAAERCEVEDGAEQRRRDRPRQRDPTEEVRQTAEGQLRHLAGTRVERRQLFGLDVSLRRLEHVAQDGTWRRGIKQDVRRGQESSSEWRNAEDLGNAREVCWRWLLETKPMKVLQTGGQSVAR